ncbi:MAG: PRD domain-containing protein [Blautia sp.]|nr:PRD domain-containing protein [Blautia sp.]
MYNIKKVLNHNVVIGYDSESWSDYLIMDKGIGFGRKTGDVVQPGGRAAIYSLKKANDRGDAREMAETIPAVYLEIASEVLDKVEEVFGKIDRNILFPMADHIEYAVKRVRNNEQISNPLTEDIRILFHMEYKTAGCIREILMQKMGILIDDDEVGYIALHIHSAIEDEKVSHAMQMARAVRECISYVEQEVGKPIDVMSLSYNRLMNHIRYMVARTMSGETLKVNMNDYMRVKFPQAFEMAETVCRHIERNLKCKLSDAEVGYLAMHIERVASDEQEAK